MKILILALSLAWPHGGGRAAESGARVLFHLKIASQPLEQALQDFARQSGTQIVFFSRLTEGLRAPALDGDFTLEAALAMLLSRSRLAFRVLNPKTIEIKPQTGPRRSGGLEKSAARPEPLDEVIVSGTAEGLVATRTATPLRAIPQTISVISREQLRQQNTVDLADALAFAPGVTLVRTDSLGQSLYARGFPVTAFHVDGGAALNSLNPAKLPFLGTPDLSEYDHIEVLRGADGLFGGNSDPGATVSLVRKRPRQTASLDIDAWAGSWNNYRMELDVSGPLALDGALRGRLDGVLADRDYFYDLASFTRKKVFGALEYDVTPATILIAGGSFQRDDAMPFVGGLPRNTDGSDPHLPRHFALGFEWARASTHTREAYLQARHTFWDDWALRANTTSWQGTVEYAIGVSQSAIDPVTHGPLLPIGADFTTRPNTQNQFAIDVTLTGAFDWFGRREEFAIGGDYTRFKANSFLAGYQLFPARAASLFDYDPGVYADPRLTGQSSFLEADTVAISKQGGLFASLKVHVNEAWSVVAGARVGSDRIVSHITLPRLGFETGARFGSTREVTPYAGVLFNLDSHYTLYASYVDVYRSVGLLQRPDGRFLGAANGVDIEAGIKGAWYGGALNGSLVVYRIDQSGYPVRDLVTPAVPNTTNCCYGTDVNRSRGVDVEITGAAAPDWLLSAGYTWNVTRPANPGDLQATTTPRHLLKVWTSKQLSGRFDRWSVGGSVHAQSRNSRRGLYCPRASCLGGVASYDVTQRSYVVADLRASYQIDAHWRTALTVNNVFDRSYYETIGGPERDNWYGEPRGFLLRIEGSY